MFGFGKKKEVDQARPASAKMGEKPYQQATTWRDADLEKWLRKDLEAAISLLNLIRNTPHIWAACVVEFEKMREAFIEREKQLKKDEQMRKEASNGQQEHLKPV